MSSSNVAKPLSSESTNARGIPQAPFVEDVEKFTGGREHVEDILKSFDEMLQKYKFMEMNTLQREAGLKAKVPDIQKTLDTVNFLSTKKESDESIKTTYELNDTLFAQAEIAPSNSVFLWLGANVMLQYPFDEAVELLQSKLDSAKVTLQTCGEDLEFLRENITTLEVNIARVYNYDVQLRREEREKQSRTSSS